MRAKGWIASAVTVMAIATAPPAGAASPGASCTGQYLSTVAPAFGRELGQSISVEARDAEELFGTRNLGEAVSGLSRADREGCPDPEGG